MFDCGSAQEASAAWAIGALDGDDLWNFHQHLAQCEGCRLTSLANEQLASRLAFLAPAKLPSPDLGNRIQDLARFERHSRRSSSTVRASLGAATVAVLALTITTGWALGLERQGAAPVPVAAVARDGEYGNWSGPPAAMRNLRPNDAQSIARGWIYFDPSEGRALLVAYGLAALPDDRAYQLWLVEGDTRVSGGVFAVDTEGYGWLRIEAPRAIGRFQRVGITVEPRGGSPGPTGARVLGGDL